MAFTWFWVRNHAASVATNGWTLEEFLGYTSRDKAGLGWHGWKDAELSVYEGIILEKR